MVDDWRSTVNLDLIMIMFFFLTTLHTGVARFYFLPMMMDDAFLISHFCSVVSCWHAFFTRPVSYVLTWGCQIAQPFFQFDVFCRVVLGGCLTCYRHLSCFFFSLSFFLMFCFCLVSLFSRQRSCL